MKLLLLIVVIFVWKVEDICSKKVNKAYCQRQSNLVDPGRKCRKSCKTNSDCRGAKKRCICDGFCGLSCFNPLAPCVNLTNPANGSFEYTNGRRFWSSTATYKCDEGFALRGVGMRTCQSDRMWSGEEPFCSDLGVCGQSLNAAGIQQQISTLSRVVGGVDAKEGAWPWQVGIFNERLDVLSTFDGGLFGGGSLINKHWILTAAHVIVELEKNSNYLNRMILALGFTELPSKTIRASASGKTYRSRFVIKHPQYEQASLFDYDFALIRIGKQTLIQGDVFRDLDEASGSSVKFSDYIRPICLPCTGTCVTPDELIGSRGERLLSGKETPEEACAIEGAWLSGRANAKDRVEAIVTGFGSTKQRNFLVRRNDQASKKLQQAVLTVEEDGNCQGAITRLNQFQQERFRSQSLYLPYTKQMICARNDNENVEIDACQGDSGGPIMREIKTSNRTCWIQLGVVSFGFGCAWKQNDYSYPGFYSDVSTVSYWINSCKTRLTDAARTDDLTCEIGATCRVLPIANGIDAQTDSFPLLQEGFEVHAHTLVRFTCINNDQTVVGPDVITCLPNGSWSEPYPTSCERQCHLSEVSEDFQVRTSAGTAINIKKNFRGGEQVVFSCTKPNAVLIGNHAIRCMPDGTWNGAFPVRCRERPSYCQGVGDPHYTSFDGKRFDFQGTCSYVFVQNKDAESSPEFLIEVDNEHRGGNTRVAWYRKAYVRIEETTIELLKGRVVKIDGALVNLPYESPDGLFTVKFSGRFVTVETTFGLEVNYDGYYYLSVGLESMHAGNVKGLCGNFNGNPGDDFELLDSSNITNDATEFGNQFQTNTKQDCTPTVHQPPNPCPEERRFEQECSVLTKPGGCFQNCSRIDPQPYFDDCVFDACAFGDARVSLENNVGAYAKACQDLGVQICPTWRKEANIPLDCPANSIYSACASRCPRTCTSEEDLACDQSCIEGCECDAGHVLSGDKCVLLENCGCQYKGQYYQAREKFYEDVECKSFCVCSDGKVTCQSLACKKGLTCGFDEKGKRACIPMGQATCAAWGDPHYRTFDGSGVFDFMGTCTYIMTQTLGISSSNSRWFSISSTNEHRYGNTRVSYLQRIDVALRKEQNVVLWNNGSIFLNGERIDGYDRTFLKIAPSGRNIRLSTSHGLIVLFNGNEVRITLPSSYIGKVNGICGSYNGDKSDDLQTANGTVTNDFRELALSYKVGDCDDNIPEPFVCPPDDLLRWGNSDNCGAITSKSGVFSTCHQAVDPTTFFDKCVFDVCATSGSASTLAEALDTYAQECQAQEIPLCNWRDRTNSRSIVCPTNSRYEGCASPCPDTCQSPYASASCAIDGFVEDCVCDVGFIRDGAHCVRRSKCGNVVGGIYRSISSGQEYGTPRLERTFLGFSLALDRVAPIAQLPRAYDYTYDSSALNAIADGGRDLYDAGNRIKVYKNGTLAIDVVYNETYRFRDYGFASIAKHPFMSFLYLFNRDLDHVNYTLQVYGNAGADNRGRITLYNGLIAEGNYRCQYFVFQIWNALDATICEVYALYSSFEEWHSVLPDAYKARFGTSTDDLDNAIEVVGRMQNVVLGYVLLSREFDYVVTTEDEVRSVLGNTLRLFATDDTNECLTNNGGCEDVCIDYFGGFKCDCTTRSNYVLNADKRTCSESVARSSLLRAALTASELSTVIPFWYNYTFDGTPSSISDGGNDMYDHGNIVRIFEGTTKPIDAIQYGTYQNLESYGYALSEQNTYPFMAFVWIENSEREVKTYSIQVDSNFGADGTGTVVVNRGRVVFSGGRIDFRAFQIYGATDPSICEVYFVMSREGITGQAYSIDENFSDSSQTAENRIEITGRPQNLLLSYALLSKQQGLQIMVDEITDFLRRVGSSISQEVPLRVRRFIGNVAGSDSSS